MYVPHRPVLALAWLLACAQTPASADPIEPAAKDQELHASTGVNSRYIDHKGGHYRVVTVDLRVAHLDLYGQGTRGHPRTIGALDTTLKGEGLLRVAATNAGIYQPNLRPGGLHIEGGATLQALNLREGAGNFHLMPNGVFYVDDAGAHVVDSTKYLAKKVRIATQSGPALLLDGALHPAFMPQSPNLLSRNGVGVSDGHTVHLVFSENSVRFHDMATLFRDVLGCTDALYLDGVISGLWADGFPHDQQVQKYAGFLVVTAPIPTP